MNPNQTAANPRAKDNTQMNSIKNIARVTGLLYVLIEIFDFSSTLYVPTNSSHAATVWLAFNSILEGFVGRVEIVGGLWVLLITWGALLAGRLPKQLNYLGVVTGVAGILTVVPALEVLGNGFRLGEIVWNVWLGIVMFRRRSACRPPGAAWLASPRASCAASQ